MERYDSVQLMRGIAALAVTVVHVPMFFTGHFGVDLFFCISGFIMMHVTEGKRESAGAAFLIKRVVRIVPPYWVATAAMCAALIFIPEHVRTAQLGAEYVIKSLLFVPFTFVAPNGGRLHALYGVGWTLVYEVFFYLLFFVSMKISHKRRDRICAALLVFFVAVPPLLGTDNRLLAYYSNSIILEFALGMLAYRLLTRRGARVSAEQAGTARLLLLLPAALIFAGLFYADSTGFFQLGSRLVRFGLPTFAVFLLIFKAFENRELPRWVTFPGDISYSLYLVHYFVIHGFSRMVYDLDVFSVDRLLLLVFVVLPACVAVSWASWRIIERKFCGWLQRVCL